MTNALWISIDFDPALVRDKFSRVKVGNRIRRLKLPWKGRASKTPKKDEIFTVHDSCFYDTKIDDRTVLCKSCNCGSFSPVCSILKHMDYSS